MVQGWFVLNFILSNFANCIDTECYSFMIWHSWSDNNICNILVSQEDKFKCIALSSWGIDKLFKAKIAYYI